MVATIKSRKAAFSFEVPDYLQTEIAIVWAMSRGNPMNRRTFVSMVASAASPLVQRAAGAQPPPKAQNVVLVHGLFADGSCWSEVIARLQSKAIQVTSVQNPLTTLREAVEATQRALALQQGSTVLAGHSFSGMIITEVGVDPKVSALVYVAARA
jgi:pimeloyl-ACP methyl ester carboxylesterase